MSKGKAGNASEQLCEQKVRTGLESLEMQKKILVYTDSRGQHTPRGADAHAVFAERLAKRSDIDATIVLCPMKWTTTLDFLAFLEANEAEKYDHIILHTGIVEWSPRPQDSALADLYNNTAPANLHEGMANTRDYSRKVINNKKNMFDSLFGEASIQEYLEQDLGVEFEGKPTVNMYGLEHAKASLLPRLKAIDNLIFINSNRFVKGWAGDHARGRPDNISLTEEYSACFRDALGADKTIDLLAWSDEDIKRFTCDNIHFTKLGSDWIYQQLCDRMGLSEPAFELLGRALQTPRIMTSADRVDVLKRAGLKKGDQLATLIIGFRFPVDDPSRMENMMFLLDWIDAFYGDLFDVLLVEQDETSKIDLIAHRLRPYVRHEFLYNPAAYNRGWGYNVSVKDMTDLAVVALMDTDVLTSENFVQVILDCMEKYVAVSPYSNVYFTDEAEADFVKQDMGFERLQRADGVSKPTTIAGGVLIMRRSTYLDLKGFEQYTGYGGEDRALDVMLMACCAPEEIYMAPSVYAHMHHPIGKVDRSHLTAVLDDLSNHYGCFVDRNLTAVDDIHKRCNHSGKEQAEKLLKRREASFADPELYRSGRELTIAGHYVDEVSRVGTKGVIFPPDFKGLEDYVGREHYKAPPHDAEGLAGLYNKYKGERCFIIGNGPSLNKHDLSLLEGEYTFAVNSFYYKTQETGFRPTFFVVEDSSVMKENAEQIRNYEAPFKFFPTNYRSLHPDAENVFFFNMNRGFYEKTSPNYCVPRFSTDASQILYCGQSVTYINLQLAFFMGFTEVHLIGMDFDYVIPKEHERSGDLILSTTDDPNHFHKDYFGAGKTWKDPKLERVGMNYKQAKVSYEAVGRKIYNATIGGKLEIFERSDYNSLFEGDALPTQIPPRTPQKIKTISAATGSSDKADKPASAAPVVSATRAAPASAAAAPVVSAAPAAPASATAPAGAPQRHEPAAPAPHKRPFYVGFAEGLRARSPLAFKAAQITWRIGLALLRRPVLLILALGLVAAGVWGTVVAPPLGKAMIIGGAVALFLLGCIGYVALFARRYLLRLSVENQTLRAENAKNRKDAEAAIAKTTKHSNTVAATYMQTQSRQLSAIIEQGDERVEALMQAQIETVGKAISGLQLHTVDMRTEVSRLKSDTSGLQSSVSGLQTGASELGSAISDLQTEASEIASALKETSSVIQTHVAGLRSDLDKEKTAREQLLNESLSFDILSVLRALRPSWLAESEVERLNLAPTYEHGHYLLMSLLADEAQTDIRALKNKTIVEIGSSRELIHTQRSTQKIGIFSSLLGLKFITVDMDPVNTKAAASMLARVNPSARAICSSGEKYLNTYTDDLDYVYLDAFDFAHDNHSEQRQESYRKNLATTINDEACWKMHWECAQKLALRMKVGGIVVFDDTWRNQEEAFDGKGKTAIPYLQKRGFEIIAEVDKAVAMRRTELAN